ncbi:MAG: ChbG/HpnK family deacetylase [candidate division Zixibacteria bacterium]|nr:ChbG/HpnK family deacetylase [candidate division Zixibacteria bacterium]
MATDRERGRVRLIVNADDLGSSAAVNRGVERACREGIVTSASLMAGGPAFDDALAGLDDLAELGVGVHLTLAGGLAVLDAGGAPTLAGPGRALPKDAAAFARAFYSGKISLADVRAELRAQIARVSAAGIRITHLDGHQHLHNLPGVAAVVIGLAREFGVRAVRLSRCRLWPPGRRWLGRQLALCLFAEAFGVRARRAGLRMPDGLEGQEWAGALTVERLLAIVARLEPGTRELVCHPAAREPSGHADADGYGRAGELRALTAPAVRAALQERGVRLINYAAL